MTRSISAMNPNTSNPGPGPSLPPCTSHYGRSPSSTAPLVPEQDQHYYSLASFYDSLPHATNRRTNFLQPLILHLRNPFWFLVLILFLLLTRVPDAILLLCLLYWCKCLMFHRWILPQFVFLLLVVRFLVLLSIIIKIQILFTLLYMRHFLRVHLCLQLMVLISCIHGSSGGKFADMLVLWLSLYTGNMHCLFMTRALGCAI